MIPPLFMVFDVESVGLHGEGFAVGWVVVDCGGKELAHGRAACHPDDASGDDAGREWVAANIPATILPAPRECGPIWVREEFWLAWREWNAHPGAILVADCAWPVEARFLARCVDDKPAVRTWHGPYPLHDLASIRLAAGLDPLGTNERLPDELPAHDPLADARQSARLLIEALRITGTLAPEEPPIPDPKPVPPTDPTPEPKPAPGPKPAPTPKPLPDEE